MKKIKQNVIYHLIKNFSYDSKKVKDQLVQVFSNQKLISDRQPHKMDS